MEHKPLQLGRHFSQARGRGGQRHGRVGQGRQRSLRLSQACAGGWDRQAKEDGMSWQRWWMKGWLCAERVVVRGVTRLREMVLR